MIGYNYRKFAEIFAAQCAPVANGKNVRSENFQLFCLDTLGSKVNILINFFLSSSLEGVDSLILFQLFSAGVVGTGGAH